MWQSLSLSPDETHLVMSYGDSSSSSVLMYNFFADLLLDTGVVPQIVSGTHLCAHLSSGTFLIGDYFTDISDANTAVSD